MNPSNGGTRAAIVSFCMLAIGCERPREIVRIDGSAGVAPLVGALVTEYRRKHHGDSVVVMSGMGSAERLRALTDGRIDIAMASHGVDEADVHRRGMRAHTVARTPVVFAVNVSVPIASLTRQQICDIFAGTISNWRQLGGPDQAIKAGMRPAAEVDSEVASATLDCLKKRPFGPQVQIIERPDDMARAITITSGAIGLTSGTMVEQSGGQMRAVALDGISPDAANVEGERYPMSRRSMLVTRNPTERAVARFLGFIRGPDGATVIRANGAVPVTETPR